MKLIVVRHAIAFERDPARWPDDADRPLTDAGKRRFRRVARRLELVPGPEVVFSSPLLRAWQTAELLRDAGWPEPKVLHELSPGVAPAALAAALASDRARTVAVVGHEPGLSHFAAWLLHGPDAPPAIAFRKGGLGLIDLPVGPKPATGNLRWLVTPRVLLNARVQ